MFDKDTPITRRSSSTTLARAFSLADTPIERHEGTTHGSGSVDADYPDGRTRSDTCDRDCEDVRDARGRQQKRPGSPVPHGRRSANALALHMERRQRRHSAQTYPLRFQKRLFKSPELEKSRVTRRSRAVPQPENLIC